MYVAASLARFEPCGTGFTASPAGALPPKVRHGTTYPGVVYRAYPPFGGESAEVSEVQQGLDQLSPRERGVVRLLAQGKTGGEIAAATGLAESTVRGYLKSARQKTRTTNRVELADWWERHSGVA